MVPQTGLIWLLLGKAGSGTKTSKGEGMLNEGGGRTGKVEKKILLTREGHLSCGRSNGIRRKNALGVIVGGDYIRGGRGKRNRRKERGSGVLEGTDILLGICQDPKPRS